MGSVSKKRNPTPPTHKRGQGGSRHGREKRPKRRKGEPTEFPREGAKRKRLRKPGRGRRKRRTLTAQGNRREGWRNRRGSAIYSSTLLKKPSRSSLLGCPRSGCSPCQLGPTVSLGQCGPFFRVIFIDGHPLPTHECHRCHAFPLPRTNAIFPSPLRIIIIIIF